MANIVIPIPSNITPAELVSEICGAQNYEANKTVYTGVFDGEGVEITTIKSQPDYAREVIHEVVKNFIKKCYRLNQEKVITEKALETDGQSVTVV